MSDGTGGLKDVDYVFSKAIYLPDNGYGTETGEKIPISKIHITDQQVVEWYDADNALLGRQKWGIEDGHPSPFKIRCMYSSSSKEELKILSREELLDSTSKGVRMYMKDYSFNYEGLNETLGGFVDGNQNAKQGLVKKRLVDGYPVAADGTSLKPWFEDGVQVNRLFLLYLYDRRKNRTNTSPAPGEGAEKSGETEEQTEAAGREEIPESEESEAAGTGETPEDGKPEAAGTEETPKDAVSEDMDSTEPEGPGGPEDRPEKEQS